MPGIFIKEIMHQDANIVRFLLKLVEKYLNDRKMPIVAENFTYENYLAAKVDYLTNNNLLSTNYHNIDDNSNLAFQEKPCMVKDVLNTSAIIQARKNNNNNIYVGRIVALNLANANTPLGAATRSRHGTQEEYFGHNSSLFLDIYSGLNDEAAKNKILAIYFDLFMQHNGKLRKGNQVSERRWKKAHEAIRAICKEAKYSLHGATAFLHRDVIFFDAGFHQIDGRNYHQIPSKPFHPDIIHSLAIADIVSVAALNLNRLTRDPDKAMINDKQVQTTITREKIEKCIEVADHANANFLILGALGCGAFKNPVEEIASQFKAAIKKLGVHTPIVFAIFGNDKTGVENRAVFNRVLSQTSELYDVLELLKKEAAALQGLSVDEKRELDTLIADLENSDDPQNINHAKLVYNAILAKNQFTESIANPHMPATDNSANLVRVKFQKQQEHLEKLYSEATRLSETPNFKKRGVLMMALGAALIVLSSVTILAGALLIPSGAGSALGISAITGGALLGVAGIGLFSYGARTYARNKELKQEYIANNNPNAEKLKKAYSILRK